MSLRDSLYGNTNNKTIENENDEKIMRLDENDNDNEESIENNGDSSDINLSDDNSDESL